jgi:hypothetical protein
MGLPNNIVGASPFVNFLNRHRDATRMTQPSLSSSALVSQTIHGVAIEAPSTLPVIQEEASSGGGTFRGEYFSGASYLIGDMVIVASGANAGTYICVKDNPASTDSPWLGGGYWIKLVSGNALGQWM